MTIDQTSLTSAGNTGPDWESDTLANVRRLLTPRGHQPVGAYRRRIAKLFDLTPDGAGALVDVACQFSDSRWQAGKIAGIFRFPFAAGPRFDQASAALIRMDSGVIFPAHRHAGPEWGLILQGQMTRLQDHKRQTFRPGDLVVTDANISHSIVSDGTESLLWLLASYGDMTWQDGKV